MSKYLLLLFILSSSAQADHRHTWTKVSEHIDKRGDIVCKWSCPIYPKHYTITKGYFKCPEPERGKDHNG